MGQNNMKFFLQYVVYVFTGGCFAFALFVYKGIYCYYNGRSDAVSVGAAGCGAVTLEV